MMFLCINFVPILVSSPRVISYRLPDKGLSVYQQIQVLPPSWIYVEAVIFTLNLIPALLKRFEWGELTEK